MIHLVLVACILVVLVFTGLTKWGRGKLAAAGFNVSHAQIDVGTAALFTAYNLTTAPCSINSRFAVSV